MKLEGVGEVRIMSAQLKIAPSIRHTFIVKIHEKYSQFQQALGRFESQVLENNNLFLGQKQRWPIT